MAIAVGPALCRMRPMINSITNEKRKIYLIGVAACYDAEVINLAIGEHGMPETTDNRLQEAQALLEKCKGIGIRIDIGLGRMYVDVVCMSVGSSPEQGVQTLEVVHRIKKELGVKTLAEVSNVSFGLPKRRLPNHTYLSMLLEACLDAAIMNPTDTDMMDTIYASHALLGTDRYCVEYIKHWRKLR